METIMKALSSNITKSASEKKEREADTRQEQEPPILMGLPLPYKQSY